MMNFYVMKIDYFSWPQLKLIGPSKGFEVDDLVIEIY